MSRLDAENCGPFFSFSACSACNYMDKSVILTRNSMKWSTSIDSSYGHVQVLSPGWMGC